ncbi:MAG: S41 family peptidase [Spirochaetales bacterium]
MKLDNNTPRKNERLVWIGVSVVLVGIIFALLLSPTVLAQSSSNDKAELIDSFEEIFSYIDENFVEDVDRQELIQGAVQGMIDSLDDRYSAYLDAEEMENLGDVTSGSFGGVGMVISRTDDDDDGYVEVVEPIPETPAFEAGVRIGDEIYEIDGESAQGLSTEEAANRLRGPEGSEVDLTIRRAGSQEIDLTLERAQVEVPTVRHELMPNSIGYMNVSSFTPFTVPRMEEAIEDFESEDYEGLVIDLRGNTGGLLNSAVQSADMFLDDGVIVGTTSRVDDGDNEYEASSGTEVDDDLPIVVLVDGGSASGAEILAGALQDTERAVLVGTTTFGKGSVQQVQRAGAIEGGFRLTLSRYYTPDGTYIDEEGIEPDYEEEMPSLSDEEQERYAELLESAAVDDFLDDDEDPDESAIDEFVNDTASDYDLPERSVGRLVREEIARRDNRSLVYDLEYDTVLQKAVELIREGEVAGR